MRTRVCERDCAVEVCGWVCKRECECVCVKACVRECEFVREVRERMPERKSEIV